MRLESHRKILLFEEVVSQWEQAAKSWFWAGSGPGCQRKDVPQHPGQQWQQMKALHLHCVGESEKWAQLGSNTCTAVFSWWFSLDMDNSSTKRNIKFKSHLEGAAVRVRCCKPPRLEASSEHKSTQIISFEVTKRRSRERCICLENKNFNHNKAGWLNLAHFGNCWRIHTNLVFLWNWRKMSMAWPLWTSGRADLPCSPVWAGLTLLYPHYFSPLLFHY